MKYIKLFESYERIPKKELSDVDTDRIDDVLSMYLVDYDSKLVGFDQLYTGIPGDGSKHDIYYSNRYDHHSNVYKILIKRNYKSVNGTTFISDIAKIKDRLSKFGYVSTGQSTTNKWTRVVTYILHIFKPLFPTKSMFRTHTKVNESFKSDDYLDYLMSQVDETKIVSKQVEDNFIYIKYDVRLSEVRLIKQYLGGMRFKDVEIVLKYVYDHIQDCDLLNLLIVDKDFYERNQNILVGNIKWVDHDIVEAMSGSYAHHLKTSFEYSEAKKAVGLPEGLTMIKNFGRRGIIEFWPQKFVDEPIKLWENDVVELQYLLFKYFGK